ncbi:right-handed parallel beta-helix repeat-containing protein, partial [Candidatus Poribacteria bacterium]|nr:right-handed parallel beta-helix repeat-containing protein [Candidatus Poribacteria bacterium]
MRFPFLMICLFTLMGCMEVTQMTNSENISELKLFVATNGNDNWSGHFSETNKAKDDGPFATLERARDEIRRIRESGKMPLSGIKVEIKGGVYYLEKPFELEERDSGDENAPIVYCAKANEEVKLLGGRVLTNFEKVKAPEILNRLSPEARNNVLQSDLKALGITSYGEVKGGGIELFFQDKPMVLSRWPKDDFVRIVGLVGDDPVDVRGTKGDKIGKFIYEGDRPKQWPHEKDIWVHGYWFWDWSDQRHKVESIDIEKRIISVVPPYHGYGYRIGQWFYYFNLLAELDTPGEWYLDRETGILYFLPPVPIEQGNPTVSVLNNLVTMKNVSYVTMQGITFEAARGNAVVINNGQHNRIIGCTLRNLGGWAVIVSGGVDNGVTGCHIYEIGSGGISISGGERRTLTPANQFADNNHIHNYGRWNRMYQPAISISGVGNKATHNLIHDAPHIA